MVEAVREPKRSEWPTLGSIHHCLCGFSSSLQSTFSGLLKWDRRFLQKGRTSHRFDFRATQVQHRLDQLGPLDKLALLDRVHRPKALRQFGADHQRCCCQGSALGLRATHWGCWIGRIGLWPGRCRVGFSAQLDSICEKSSRERPREAAPATRSLRPRYMWPARGLIRHARLEHRQPLADKWT